MMENPEVLRLTNEQTVLFTNIFDYVSLHEPKQEANYSLIQKVYYLDYLLE